MKPYTVTALVVVVLDGAGCASAPRAGFPVETVRLRASALPGYDVARQKCDTCHSVDYVAYQPPGMTQAQWTAEMTKMQHAYGAPISDDEVKLLAQYLAVTYGSGTAVGTGAGR